MDHLDAYRLLLCLLTLMPTCLLTHIVSSPTLSQVPPPRSNVLVVSTSPQPLLQLLLPAHSPQSHYCLPACLPLCLLQSRVVFPPHPHPLCCPCHCLCLIHPPPCSPSPHLLFIPMQPPPSVSSPTPPASSPTESQLLA
jgi:hypothetical protein